MAGNYRSSDNGIGKSVGRAVHASRSTHIKKNVMEKQREMAKDVISHRETERRKTEHVKGSYAVQREQVKVAQIKQRGSEARKNVKAKAKVKNDLQVGKKTKEAPKKRKLPTDRKW